jgi:TolA-binding protein
LMHCRYLVFFASFVFVLLAGLLAVDGAFCLTLQDVPAAELPTTTDTTPGVGSSPTPGATPSTEDLQSRPSENYKPQESASGATAQDDTNGKNSPGDNTGSADLETGQGADTVGPQPDAEATPPPPALDASAMTVGPELGNESLDPEITKAVAPAMAASLRLAESARKLLGDGQVDGALRELARAVSLDPSDAFAYYYLGRAYFMRRNYTQALTFFRRAEIGFNGRHDWTAEALSYEGICDEELDKAIDAFQAYKRALAMSPNNFRARVGYGRLASIAGPVENVDAPPPAQDLAISPPEAPDESAPPEQPPPLPPE